jgi:predicted permease
VKTLFRAFLAQFFASETVASDVQLRQAIAGVLAFIITPCLFLLPRGFGQYQPIAYHAGMQATAAAVARWNAVRALAFDDAVEAKAGVLIAYSMIIVGLVAVYAWDALTFDRRDAMVLGPLPLRPSAVMTAKAAALGALLLGTSFGVGVLNSLLFGLQAADRAGWHAFILTFFASVVVTVSAAIFAFCVVVIARSLVVMVGGARLTNLLGSAIQLLLVVGFLELVVIAFASRAGISVPPVTWFVAWFEVLRHSPRAEWTEVTVLSQRAWLLAPAAVGGALVTSVLTFQLQMRRALTPLATVGPVGRATISRTVARTLCRGDRFAHAISDFLLITISRSRAQQTPIAMNAGIGVALVAISLARPGGMSSASALAAPLMLAYWAAIGLRAAFFVPSELPSAWTFQVNAPDRVEAYAKGVRASIVALLVPAFTAVAFVVGGWAHAARAALLIVALADILVLTIDFLPFTRAYRAGHAKLKTRWPLYAIGAYLFAYASLRISPVFLLIPVAALELALSRLSRRRWTMAFSSDRTDDSAVTLDLIGASGVDADVAPDRVSREREPLIRGTWSDIRYAVRLLRRERAFSVLVVTTMALAIGANVTMFTIVDGMPGRPPIPNEDRAIVLASTDRAGHPLGVSYADFQDWRSQTRTIAQMVAYRGIGINLTDRGLTPERATTAYISADTFRLVGERPILGRDFSESDDQPGAAPVAILGGGLWTARYGSDAAIIGKTIRANGVDVTVIGVMRPGFRFPLVHDLWMPLATAPDLLRETRDTRTLQVVGRLRDNVTLEQARADLAVISDVLSRNYPLTNRDTRTAVAHYSDNFAIANPWDAMLLAVSFVLIIGCANVANLLLARGAKRAHEVAIRRSIGATRWQLIRQLLVEHSLLAGAAGVLGLVLGVVGLRFWVGALPVADWPYWFKFGIHRDVFGYVVAVVVACAVLFGVGPAIATSRATATEPSRFWTNGLLVIQFTLTLALLAGAGLLAKTLAAVYRADSVLDTTDVVLANVDLPSQRYESTERQLVLYTSVEDRLATSRDVEAASFASAYPFYDAPRWLVELEESKNSLNASMTASYVTVGPRYFDTLRLKLRQGRGFTRDDGSPGQESVIVNERFVAMYLHDPNPVGRRIRLINPRVPNRGPTWLTIVGVSPMVRQHYAQDFDPVVYVPYRWNPTPSMTLIARSARMGVSIAGTLRSALAAVDPELPLQSVTTLDQIVAGTRFANVAFAAMFSTFATIALLLAAIGLHAVTAYAVTRRTKEIGIRMALGAQTFSVSWMFVRQILPALILGTTFGIAGAAGVGQFVRSMLAGTSPRDPVTLVAISVVLVGVALLSTFVPALRAANLDPAAALRHD